jgi:hypothetical protein
MRERAPTVGPDREVGPVEAGAFLDGELARGGSDALGGGESGRSLAVVAHSEERDPELVQGLRSLPRRSGQDRSRTFEGRAEQAGRILESRVLHEDRPLQLAQLDAGLEPEIVDEADVCPPVGLQRIGLPA